MPEHFTHRAICQLHLRGQVIKDHFVSQALATNPLGDPAERDLLVYLPPGYERSPGLRYPVIFALAGYSETDASLQNWLPFQPTLSDRLDLLTDQGLLGAGLIVVMPDCFTAYGGSQYLNSSAVATAATCSSSCAMPAISLPFATSSAAQGDWRPGITLSRHASRRLKRI